jgi:hypothetical protein
VTNYLTASFDFMFTATDEQIGYPADGNRLVQGWVWYSLNDDYWNGSLFDPNTKTLTVFGTTWKDYVSNPANPLASQPQRNLLVTNLQADPNPAYVSSGDSMTINLRADIANSGNTNTSTGNNIMVSFWDGDPNEPSSNQIGNTQILDDLAGCGRFTTVEVDWPDIGEGNHVWYVKVDPITGETNSDDNVASSIVSVIEGAPPPEQKTYLPIILK